jgi:hypothetical protein
MINYFNKFFFSSLIIISLNYFKNFMRFKLTFNLVHKLLQSLKYHNRRQTNCQHTQSWSQCTRCLTQVDPADLSTSLCKKSSLRSRTKWSYCRRDVRRSSSSNYCWHILQILKLNQSEVTVIYGDAATIVNSIDLHNHSVIKILYDFFLCFLYYLCFT